jgi:hypothetical protein
LVVRSAPPATPTNEVKILGWTTIEKCCACGADQENLYGGGFISRIVHCSACGAETLLGCGETPGPCKNCGGQVLPDGQPVCKQCGGREWIIPEGRAKIHSRWD